MAVGSLPLTLTTGTAPMSKTEVDPVTGRPLLSLSVNLDLKMDIAGLVESMCQRCTNSGIFHAGDVMAAGLGNRLKPSFSFSACARSGRWHVAYSSDR